MLTNPDQKQFKFYYTINFCVSCLLHRYCLFMNLNLCMVFHNFKTHLACTGTPMCMCTCCIQWSGTGPQWEIRWIIVASIQLQIAKDVTGRVLVQSAQNTLNLALPLLPIVDISFMGNASRNLSQQVAMSVPFAGGLQWPCHPLKQKGEVDFSHIL